MDGTFEAFTVIPPGVGARLLALHPDVALEPGATSMEHEEPASKVAPQFDELVVPLGQVG